MIFWKKNKPSNSLLYRQPEIRWRIPPVNKSFTLRPVSILALGGGGGGGGGGVAGLGGPQDFRGEGGGGGGEGGGVVAGFRGSQDFQGEWRGGSVVANRV